jgi:2-C-methyl-D-erythritol 4-phosphate cytidylyltransferase
MNERVVGVILAAGSGSRFDSEVPKQYHKLSGKMVIQYSIDKFLNHDEIDSVFVVVHKDHLPYWNQLYDIYGNTINIVITHSTSRNMSTKLVIEEIYKEYLDSTKVLIHDSVRPLITDEIISSCIEKLDIYPCIDTVVPCTDTIITSNDNKMLSSIPDRSTMYSGQTPQGFYLGKLSNCYNQLDTEQVFTDDCGVFKYYYPDQPIGLVDGSPTNIKITYKTDLILADHLLRLNGDPKVVKTNKKYLVIGGTSGIGKYLVDTIKIQEPGSVVKVLGSKDIDLSILINEEYLGELVGTSKYDHVIITSGKLRIEPLSTTSRNTILELTNINYLNQVLIIRYLLSNNLINTNGSITLFSSSSYTLGRTNYSIYSSTKAAIVNFTQALASELSNDGIRVNCVVPERTNTQMRRDNFPEEDHSLLLQPEEVAYRTYTELLSKNITGKILHINKR